MTPGSVLISWSCSLTHTLWSPWSLSRHTTIQKLLTTDGILKGEASGGGGGEEAEETVVRLQLLQGKFTHGMAGRRQKRRQERENMGVKIVFKCVVLDVEKK